MLIPLMLIGQKKHSLAYPVESPWIQNSDLLAFSNTEKEEEFAYNYDNFIEESQAKLLANLEVFITTGSTDCNEPNGTASAFVVGGVAGNVMWSDGQVGQTAVGLPNGPITVTVTSGPDIGVATAIVGYTGQSVLQWESVFGGSLDDIGYDILNTKDKGFLIGGYTASMDLQQPTLFGAQDFWVVKTDPDGIPTWKNNYGGSEDDRLIKMLEVSDGYILAGHSRSSDFQIPLNKGLWDFLLVKIGFNGNLMWVREYGGNSTDLLFDVRQTRDGGYIMVGGSFSPTLSIKGGADYYIVKTDPFGNVMWEKTLGGSFDDYATTVVEDYNGDFVICGYSESNDFDVSGNFNFGSWDYWLIKLDQSGSNILFSKNYGGSGNDQPWDMELTADNGVIIVGSSRSNDGNLPANYGGNDVWVLRLDQNYNILRSENYGGSSSDEGKSIDRTGDGGYLIGGDTYSSDIDIKSGNQGSSDFWLFKIENGYNIEWEETFGGPGNDFCKQAIQTCTGGYAAAGETNMGGGDIKKIFAGIDYWAFEIDQPEEIETMLVDMLLDCPGDSDGLFDLSVSGGLPPFVYNWTTNQTTQDINGLTAGNYGVTVTDARGCEKILTATIAAPPAFSASMTEISSSDCSGDNGVAEIIPSGGTPGYSYLWDNGYVDNLASFLSAGVHRVTVTDLNNCSYIRTINISEDQPANILGVNVIQPKCGLLNGSIQVNADGGTGQLTYAINGGMGQSSSIFQGLGEGTYNITITDQSSCISTATQILVGAAAPSISFSINNPTCGQANGSITSFVSGGTSPYSYSWSTGQNISMITNVEPGYFTLTVTDAAGCTATADLILSSLGDIIACVMVTNTTCGQSNGSATAIVNGGSGNYSYSWSTGQNGQTISNLPNGLISVTVSDLSGVCTGFAYNFVNFNEEPIVEWSQNYGGTGYDVGAEIQRTDDGNFIIAANTRSTNGMVSSNNGFQDFWLLKIDPSGSLLWENNYGGSILETANSVKQTRDGGYIIGGAAQSNNGDVGANYGGEDAWIVKTGPLGSIQWQRNYGGTQDDVCTSIHTTANGGYTFGGYTSSPDIDVVSTFGGMDYWLVNLSQTSQVNGQGTFGGSNQDFSYDMVPTIDKGYIMVGKTASNDGNVSNNFGSDDLWVVKVRFNGQIEWERSYGGTGSDVGRAIQQTKDGGYIITGTTSSFNGNVSNNNGNSDIWVIKIDPTGGIMWENTFGGSSFDFGRDVLQTGDGGYLVGGYVFSNDVFVSNNYGNYDAWVIKLDDSGGLLWEKNLGGRENDLLESIQLTNDGGYIVTGSTNSVDIDITNPFGDNDVWVVKLNAPISLNATILDAEILCNGDTDADLDAIVSGGTAPYTYNWSNGESTQDVFNVGAGNYTLTVTDASGCEATTETFIPEPSPLQLSINQLTPATCFGGPAGCCGEAMAIGSGGIPPYSYQWSTGALGATATNLDANTHFVTLTDNNGCNLVESITISQTPSPNLLNSKIDPSCGLSNGSITLNAIGGTAPFQYSIDGGVMTQPTNVFTNLVAGVYSPWVLDANGCSYTTPNIILTDTPGPTLSFTIDHAPCPGGVGAIDLTVTGGAAPFQFLWSNNATTEDLTNVPSSQYTVTVTDDNGCTETTAAIIVSPSPIQVTVTKDSDITCLGNDGVATVSATGGVPGYTYLWDDGTTTQTNSNLTPGLRTVTVMDSNGCTSDGVIGMPIGQPLVVSLSTKEDPTCGQLNGYINIDVGNGTTPYSYDWSNNATTQNISGLTSGTYTVTVSDVNGCVETFSTSLAEPPPLGAIISSTTDVSCFGSSDGMATVQASGGITLTLPYFYQWSASAGNQTTPTATGLSAGTHAVTVTDNIGCIVVVLATINTPQELMVSVNVTTNAPCEGTGGVATATASGGTPPISVLWDDGVGTPTNSQLTAGQHSLTVTDNNGCTNTGIVIIPTTDPPMIVSIIPTDASCGAANGAIDLTVANGVPPYDYNWNNGVPNVEDPTGLAPNLYTIEVKDANGCISTGQVSVNNAGGPVTTVDGFVEPSCDGSDGSISISVAGGLAPYTYQWDNGAGTNEDPTNLDAGTYNVTITDQNNCSAFETVTLNSPPIPTLSINANHVKCNGNSDGSITTGATGGTPPYNYQWSTGETTSSISGLSAGPYFMTFSDANNCGNNFSIMVNEPLELEVSATVENSVSCAGGTDGAALGSISGGTPPFDILWTNGATTTLATGLSSGFQEFVVTDVNGCVASANVNLIEPITISVNTTEVDPATCNGGTDGAAQAAPTGGTVASDYQYLWSNGATTSVFNGAAGNYGVTVTDDNGCTGTGFATISEPSMLVTATNQLSPSNCDIDNGSAQTAPSGGTPPFFYLWDNGETTNVATALGVATHFVTVTDANGCILTDDVIINGGAPPEILSIIPTDPTCGAANGSIDLTVSPGTGAFPYTYLWDNGAGTDEDPTGLTAGTYSVTVTGSDGCSVTAETLLNNANGPTITSSHVDPTCGEANGSIDLVLTGGTLPYTFIWDNGIGNIQNPFDLPAGVYNVTVEDASGCQVFDNFNLIDAGSPVISDISTIPETCGSGNGSISVTVSGGTPPYSYNWDNGESTAIISNLTAGIFNLTVTDFSGCQVTASETTSGVIPVTLDQVIISQPSCAMSNGSITVQTMDGNPPIEYSIDGGATFLLSNLFENLPAGFYDVMAIDADGCESPMQTEELIDEDPPLIVSINTTNADCGEPVGTIDIIAASSGGFVLGYSIDGGVNYQPSNAFAALVAGTYDVVVQDETGCTTSGTANVQGTPNPTIDNVITVDPNCGQPDGSIEIFVSGGTPAYQFSIDGGTTFLGTNLFAGLTAGPYDLVVADMAGCTASSSITLSSLSGPIIDNIDSTPEVCGQLNGTITILASGGQPPLEYSIDSGASFQPGNNFIGLEAIDYDIVVIDANGCLTNMAFSLGGTGGSISISIDNIIDPTCGLSNGSFDVSATGGIGPYEYSIDGGVTNQTTGIYTGLPAGIYDVVVTDTDGCSATNDVIFLLQDPPTITNVILVQPNCGSADGSIEILISSGTPTFEYSIDGGTTLQNSNIFTGLIANSYDIFVQDANGCQDTTFEVLTDQSGPSIDDVLTVDPSCQGADGSIEILASGGVPPLEYSIDNGASFQTSNIFPGLTQGTYNVVVSDANSCQNIQQTILTDEQGPKIDNFILVDPSCMGTDGSIEILASGGIAPLEYSIDNGVTFQTSNIFLTLPAGTYDAVVSDVNGCQYTEEVTLTDGPGPSMSSITVVNPSCMGADGSIDILAAGGTAPLGYSIDNGTTFQPASLFTGVMQGVYDVVVSDVNGCTETRQATLIDGPGLVIDNKSTIEPTCGQSDGSISINASGGTLPYEYSIDNGVSYQPSNTFSGLSAGTYDFIVSDVNGCFATAEVILIDQTGPTIISTNLQNPACMGADGAITINATGSTPPLEYSIDNGVSFQSGNSFINLMQGTFDIIVKDANDCQVLLQEILTDEPGPTIDNVSGVEPICSQANGSITITASGGTNPYEYSSDGGVNYQISNTLTGLMGGTYDVFVVDANGCTTSQSVMLEDQAGPTIANVVGQDPVCLGSDGTIDIAAIDGTPPYQYSNDGGASFQSVTNFSGLMAGSYDLVVKDINGCIATSTFILNDLPGPQIDNTTEVNPSCNGADGSITIIASGGVSPLEYSADGSSYQTGNTLSNLPQNTYTIHVQDANGCISTSLVTLSDSNGPSIDNVSIVDPACMGADGSITITASGGTSPLEYSSDGGTTFQSSSILSGLAQGTYNIVVRDANNCQTSDVATLTDIAGPTIVNFIAIDPNCGQLDGSITINGAAGTPPLRYSIDNGSNFFSSNLFNGLGVGPYSLVVQDINGCSVTNMVTLTDTPGSIIDSISVVDATCNFNNGEITISASNTSSATIEYSIDNGVTFQTSNSFIGLAPNVYNVVINDANNCQDASSVTISNFAPPAIFFLGVTNPSCGLSNGQISIIHNGGTAPFEFSIDNGVTYQPTNIFTGLPPGPYDMVVSDANGCTATRFATMMDQPAPVIDSVSIVDSYCGQDTGELTINITGGSLPFTYSVNNGGSFQASNTFTSLPDDTYQVVVVDGNNCSTSSTAMIADLPGPTITNVLDTPPSCGMATGTIEVQATGGTGALTYSIDNGLTFTASSIFTGLVADTYQVVVQDANGCQLAQPFDLVDIDGPVITQISDTPTTCGQANGSFIIAATSVNVPLLFSIDNGTTLQASNLFENLVAGPYTVLVQDVNGCITSQQFTLNDRPAPSITNLVTTPSVCGQANGAVTILTNGGTPPLQYSIDGTSFQSSNTFNNLLAQTYTFTVRDNNNCISTSSTSVTDVMGPTISTITTNDPACGQSNGSFTINVTNGAVPFSYSIDNGASFQSSNTFTGLVANSYQIVVEDANACSTSSTTNLINLDGPIVTSVIPTNPDCGDTLGTIEVVVMNGASPYAYMWNTVPAQTNAIATDLPEGNYIVTITDSNNCTTTAAGMIEMSVGPFVDLGMDQTSCDDPMAVLDAENPGASFLWSNGETTQSIVAEDFGIYFVTVTAPNNCTAVDSIQFSPTVFNPQVTVDTFMLEGETIQLEASGGDNYQWEAANSLSCTICPNPVASPEADTIYTVKIGTADGCTATLQVEVRVIKKLIELVFVPDVFSPNGDGMNDEFHVPYLEEFPFNRLTVINRWGDVVFDANPYLNDWTGTYKGQPLPQGTYYYILETDVNINYELKGPLTILK